MTFAVGVVGVVGVVVAVTRGRAGGPNGPPDCDKQTSRSHRGDGQAT